jgi:HEAT repeat protein
LNAILKVGLALYFLAAVALIEYRPQASYDGRTAGEWAEAILEGSGEEGRRFAVWGVGGVKVGGIEKGGDGVLVLGSAEETKRLTRGGRDALPVLIELLRHPQSWIRAEAAMALAMMGEDARPAGSFLRKALHDEHPVVRGDATHALARVGLPVETEPLLIELLGDGEKYVREMAALGLHVLGCPDAAIDPLRRALRDPDEGVRDHAVWALGSAGDRGGPAVPDLAALLAVEDARFGVIRSLGRIGPAARAAVPALIELARDPRDPRVLQTLGEIGDPRAEPVLRAAARSTYPEIRDAAGWSLQRIEKARAEGLEER